MKKVILFLTILIASLATTKAQVSIGLPVGISSLKCPTIGLNLNLRVHGLIASAGLDNQVSKDINKGNLWWSRIGAAFNLTELNSVEITAGISEHRKSSDNKALNEGLAVLNMQYIHQMRLRPEAATFVSVTGTKRFVMVTGGLRFTFLKRGYCPANRRM